MADDDAPKEPPADDNPDPQRDSPTQITSQADADVLVQKLIKNLDPAQTVQATGQLAENLEPTQKLQAAAQVTQGLEPKDKTTAAIQLVQSLDSQGQAKIADLITQSQEDTRRTIALGLLALLAVLVAAAVVIIFRTNISETRSKDLLGLILGPVVGLVGTVVGFYFGAQTAKQAGGG